MTSIMAWDFLHIGLQKLRSPQRIAGSLSEVQDTALIGAVTRRMHTAARIPFSHGELLQATEYVASEGGKYEFHLDAEPINSLHVSGRGVATFVIS